jgi:precorrin-6Y C5,15-methyltransferase (decarboxylating)
MGSLTRAVTVVGMGADGCLGVSSRALNAVAKARVLVGGKRLLEFFPHFEGERIVVEGGIGPVLERVAEAAQESTVCVLASGDPLFFGIGSLVAKRVGAEHVEIVPCPSSIQWAFASIGAAWHDARFFSVHGRSRQGIVSKLRRVTKAALLTDEENSPARIAAHLLEYGDREWVAHVCENMGGAGARTRRFALADLATETDIGPLNVLLLQRPDGYGVPPALPYLAEEAFEKRMPKKGLITKREVRALSLATMRLRDDAVVWDVGAGSGSVAIEASMLASHGQVFAVEVDEEGVAICRDNARAHGADNVTVVHGLAPAALEGLPAPDAVFVGGSKGAMDGILSLALAALKPGGRLVVNAITMDNVAESYRWFREHSFVPEVSLVQLSRGEPLARYVRYEALNPVHILAITKGAA